jgi:hypothetical protein
MDILMLILVTVGLLVVLGGILFVVFSILKKEKTDCGSNDNEYKIGCGCGKGACGLPNEH